MDKLSIIIPTLNEEKYISKLLDCLVKQTYQDFEVIVVDGYSDDKTKQVVRKYRNKFDLKLLNSEKRNVAHQRNVGASKAKFERLLFLDADVEFNKEFLRNSMRKLNQDEFASVHLIPLTKDVPEKIFFIFINFTFKLMQYIKPLSFGACIFVDKKIFHQIKGFNVNINYAEDLDLLKRLNLYSKFRILPEKIFFSTRRFEKYGTKNMIKIYIKTFYEYIFSNTISKPVYYNKFNQGI